MYPKRFKWDILATQPRDILNGQLTARKKFEDRSFGIRCDVRNKGSKTWNQIGEKRKLSGPTQVKVFVAELRYRSTKVTGDYLFFF